MPRGAVEEGKGVNGGSVEGDCFRESRVAHKAFVRSTVMRWRRNSTSLVWWSNSSEYRFVLSVILRDKVV